MDVKLIFLIFLLPNEGILLPSKGKDKEPPSIFEVNDENLSGKDKKTILGDMRSNRVTETPDGVHLDFIIDEDMHWDYYYNGTDGEQYINIPYMYDRRAPGNIKTAFQQAIDEIESRTCIRLIERTTEDYYIHVVNKGGCWSYVGKQKLKWQPQQLSLQSGGCTYKYIAIHEILHALGFWHEQSRPDRDDYVVIYEENIPQSVLHNFNKQEANTQNTPYDYLSVMHYGATDFSKNGKPTILRINGTEEEKRDLGNYEGLTDTDVEGLNLAYCHGKGTVTPTEEPEVTPTPPVNPIITVDEKFCQLVKKARGFCQYCSCNTMCRKECVDKKGKTSRCENLKRQGWCSDSKKKDMMAKNCATTCMTEFCKDEADENAKKGNGN